MILLLFYYKYYTKLYVEHSNAAIDVMSRQSYSITAQCRIQHAQDSNNVAIVTRLNIFEAYNTMSISEKNLNVLQ